MSGSRTLKKNRSLLLSARLLDLATYASNGPESAMVNDMVALMREAAYQLDTLVAEGVSRSGGEQEKNEDGGTSLTEDAAVSVSASDQRPHDMGDDKRAAIYRSLAASYAMVTPPLTAAQIHHLALFGAATVRSLLWELGVLQDMNSRDASQPDEQNARIYPCRECGVLRSKAEGGTTFTVCDECWDKLADLKSLKDQYDDELKAADAAELQLRARLAAVESQLAAVQASPPICACGTTMVCPDLGCDRHQARS